MWTGLQSGEPAVIVQSPEVTLSEVLSSQVHGLCVGFTFECVWAFECDKGILSLVQSLVWCSSQQQWSSVSLLLLLHCFGAMMLQCLVVLVHNAPHGL